MLKLYMVMTVLGNVVFVQGPLDGISTPYGPMTPAVCAEMATMMLEVVMNQKAPLPTWKGQKVTTDDIDFECRYTDKAPEISK